MSPGRGVVRVSGRTVVLVLASLGASAGLAAAILSPDGEVVAAPGSPGAAPVVPVVPSRAGLVMERSEPAQGLAVERSEPARDLAPREAPAPGRAERWPDGPAEATQAPGPREVLADPYAPPEARREAALALGDSGDPEAVRALLDLVAGCEEPDLVRFAGLALARAAERALDESLRAQVVATARPAVESFYLPALLAGDRDAFERLSAAAAALSGVATAEYLAGPLLGSEEVCEEAKLAALDVLLSSRAVEQTKALEARRGTLGTPALESRLDRVLEALRRLEG
ncbi:MAG: hypothetical protein HY720_22940 [Planctomycetes bacterium]|nr:hypothetical protein [Planctomycetota bacterium]